MKRLDMSINAGIGDNIIVRLFFDGIKNEYDQIRVSHNRHIVDFFKNGDPQYYSFLNQLGSLLFTTPYSFEQEQFSPLNIYNMVRHLNLIPQKPDLDNILCVGNSLNLTEEYIVITTKIRGISRSVLLPSLTKLWRILQQLSSKYKIVILGEREVEQNKEYGNISDIVYSIYDQIIVNLPSDRVLDLTIPALGITIPNLDKIRQDCLIMKQAKFVITLAVGGNLWLAVSVANVIGFRVDNGAQINHISDMVSSITNPKFSTSFLTPDWNQFINKLGEYK